MQDVVNYSDLDMSDFEEPAYEVTEVAYTPVDMDALKDDLTGLLSALKVHLEESKEDLINREIQAAINFSDWRYEMEEELFYFEDNLQELMA